MQICLDILSRKDITITSKRSMYIWRQEKLELDVTGRT